ncbi:hypothetical protein AWM70_04315 [Paenibacillus yonginensis]|uniref:Sugar deacetylase n=1 Tax=Paenibacillus yonginensis TaxID=1462996 RepID=A0A1B1MXI2_9BACL|nr:divergent polysaccharide deacetylase family protein [Paenibacillus yonginensis]ANS73891.1 hypothetical protein AWM70_04315 [Paenibacillus yonginensis]
MGTVKKQGLSRTAGWLVLAALGAALFIQPGPAGAAAAEAGERVRLPAGMQVEHAVPAPKASKKLAIVIDDLGNDMDGTQEIMNMPIKLTVAVMPFMRTTERDARMAHERGFDVLVHLPMEPNHGKPEWLGPGAIMSSLSDSEVRTRVEQAIDNVPYAVGINNHMGSKITADPRIMSIVLDVCRERGLFFLDSRTNYKTVVGKLCKEKGMPDIGNQFFLDDQYNQQHISKQMGKVMNWMRDHDSCIIIGHVGVPGTKTAGVIRGSIKQMPQDVEYVTLSEFVRNQSGNPILRGLWP